MVTLSAALLLALALIRHLPQNRRPAGRLPVPIPGYCLGVLPGCAASAAQ